MVGLTPDDETFITDNLPDQLYFLMARGDEGFGMIMHKNATKAKATAALAIYWGIAPGEIAAFGDDLNDLDLLALVLQWAMRWMLSRLLLTTFAVQIPRTARRNGWKNMCYDV